MIRVAWQVPNDPGWVGGLNYFVNLAHALLSQPDRQVEPVLLGPGDQLPPPLRDLVSVPYPSLPASRYRLPRLLDSVQRKVLRDGGALARQLRRHGVRLLSHGQLLGRRALVPAMCWIPDFQHRHLPKFFTPEEVAYRDFAQAEMSRNAQAVVFSSEHACSDYLRFYPEGTSTAHVLHFVAAVSSEGLPPAEEVLARHAINEPFFHVPNQLWAHKNHGIIIEALRVLSGRGRCPLVISTGQTRDYRNPGFFEELSARVRELGLGDRFRFLGLISYADMSVIMRSSVALINPSLFEGWSTTVEEAKSLGKRLLLSDIPVHREQAPERGSFFHPQDGEALAADILDILDCYDPDVEQAEAERAVDLLPHRMGEYALNYERIVRTVIGGR